jgi:hypothetical protein
VQFTYKYLASYHYCVFSLYLIFSPNFGILFKMFLLKYFELFITLHMEAATV